LCSCTAHSLLCKCCDSLFFAARNPMLLSLTTPSRRQPFRITSVSTLDFASRFRHGVETMFRRFAKGCGLFGPQAAQDDDDNFRWIALHRAVHSLQVGNPSGLWIRKESCSNSGSRPTQRASFFQEAFCSASLLLAATATALTRLVGAPSFLEGLQAFKRGFWYAAIK